MKIQSDISKLKEWFQSAQLDPNDPSNVALFDLLKVNLFTVVLDQAVLVELILSKKANFINSMELEFHPENFS